MVKKYSKKRKTSDDGQYKQRRYRKSKYGGGDRDTRRANRKFGRSKIIVPNDTRAPQSCFIKVKQVRVFNIQNIGTAILNQVQIRANGLHDQFVGVSGDYLPDKLMVYAMMYNKYYVYASKIRATFSQRETNTNSIPQSVVSSYIIPRADSTAFSELQINYDDSLKGQGAPLENIPRAHFKHYNHIQFGNGPHVIKHKCSTKKMFVKNTKTDDDYCASIVQNAFTSGTTDATPIFGNPGKMWYWNVGALRPDLTVQGGISTGQALNEFVIVEVTSYVRLYSTINYDRAMSDQ